MLRIHLPVPIPYPKSYSSTAVTQCSRVGVIPAVTRMLSALSLIKPLKRLAIVSNQIQSASGHGYPFGYLASNGSAQASHAVDWHSISLCTYSTTAQPSPLWPDAHLSRMEALSTQGQSASEDTNRCSVGTNQLRLEDCERAMSNGTLTHAPHVRVNGLKRPLCL